MFNVKYIVKSRKLLKEIAFITNNVFYKSNVRMLRMGLSRLECHLIDDRVLFHAETVSVTQMIRR